MKIIKNDREILSESDKRKVTVGKKLSMEHCKKILNSNGRNYTDEQVLIIRDFLYTMATIDYLYFTEQVLPKKLIQKQNTNEQNSDTLHQSEYRRAS